ncbi:MAG: helix-turn-helix domain-containing protein [Flavobacteriales bacterium]
MTRHKHFAPSPVLRPYIKCFHVLEIDDALDASSFERFTPDGCFEVNFNLAGAPTRREAFGTERMLGAGYTVARSSTCYFMRPAGALRLMGVRFHPWGLHRFTSVPMEVISDSAVPSVELFGSSVLALHERLAASASETHAIAELDRYLTARLNAFDEDPLITDAAQRIEQANGLLAMKELLSPYGITQRRFQQRFKQSIGTTPKGFSRLMRFQHALRGLTAGAYVVPIDLAFEGAYYDQAHFANEFRSFAGISPTRYMAEVHPLNDAAVLNRLDGASSL